MEKLSQNQIPDWLGKRVQANANKLALTVGMYSPQDLSWGEMQQHALSLAADLRERGVQPDSRVALLMNNSLRFVELFQALIQLKAVLVPLNNRLTAPELDWQLQDVGASFLIYDERNAAKAQELTNCENRIESSTLHVEGKGIAPREWLDLDELHTIIYSSGTTGKPKGVRLTYGNHFWNAVGSSLNLGNLPDDKWLIILPLFHVGGMSILFRSLIYGVPAVLHESFDPAAVNQAIDEQGVTIISVVAATLQKILGERQTKPYGQHLRCMLLGGGPAPLPLLERCEKANVPVVQTYGMTETASQFVTLAPEEAIRKLGSAGLPLLPNVLLIERDGQILPVGEVGEIVVRGPSVSPGYDNNPEATARAFKKGWFYTGDLGRLDEEGFLYVVDRRDDLIISGGENVYPAEIEAILLGHPAIEEAGVFGAPDEKWGAVPIAAVKLRDGQKLETSELQEWFAPRLARYKQPSQIIFKESLPRNAAGKLLRRVLREEFLENGNHQTPN